MEVEFDSDELDKLETDPAIHAGHGPEVVRGYRKVLWAIRAAQDTRDLHASRGLRYEQLKGKRSPQHSLRINKQWRLIIELRGAGQQKRVGIVGIEDYH